MGVIDLLLALKRILIRITKEMRLKVNIDTGFYEETTEPVDYLEELPQEPVERKHKKRAPNVYLMNLPERSDLISRIPYILIQVVDGEDGLDKGSLDSTVAVRFIIATYNDDGEEGGLQVLEIIERIRIAFEKGILLDQQFTMQMPFQWKNYTDDTGVYYLGEINTVWSIPAIRRTELSIEDAMGQ